VRTRADYLCRACFLASCLSRSRRLLTHPHLIGSRVVLGVSGGCSSLLALDVASLLLHCGRRRRWWEQGAVVHIDTSSLCQAGLLRAGGEGGMAAAPQSAAAAAGGSGQGVGVPSEALLTACLASGLHTYIVPLESAFAPGLLVYPLAAPTIALGAEGVTPAPVSGALLNAALPFAPLQRAAAAPRAALAAAELASLKATHPTLLAARAAMLAAFAACAAQPHARASPAVPPVDQCHALLQALTTRLLLEATQALRFPHLALAATLDTTAHTVFTSMCSRSGATVPCDAASVDARFAAGVQGVLLPQRREAPRALGGAQGAELTPFAPLQNNWYPAVLQESSSSGSSGSGSGTQVTSVAASGGGGGGGSSSSSSSCESSAASASLPSPTGVTIIRVAQEIEAREAALVCHFKGLQGCPRACATFLTLSSPTSSVAVRCRDVLAGLQSQFPSTLHNVVKTAQKVSAPAPGSAALCSCCGAVCARGTAHGERCAACQPLPAIVLTEQ
jgi:hypothetical protein